MKKENIKLILLIILLLLLLFFAGKYFYQNVGQDSEKENLPEVLVAPIVEKEVEVQKSYIGYVTPINSVIVRPYISGFVYNVLVKGGQNVKAGDELVVLEQDEYKALVASAAADVAKAEADFEFQEKYYNRVIKAGKKVFSQTEIDDAKTKYLNAKANLSQAKAVLAQNEVNLKYTQIKATIDGVVGNVALTKGDYVSPQSELFSIVQTNPIRVVFSISDKDYLEENSRLQMFDNEEIFLKLADGRIYEQKGVFEYADNAIDRETNAIAVYAKFENPNKTLIDKAYVTVLLKKKYKGVLVDKDLVVMKPNENFVYVEQDGVAKKYKVNILSEINNEYILENSFLPRMQLVVSKIMLAQDDQKVKPIGAAVKKDSE